MYTYTAGTSESVCVTPLHPSVLSGGPSTDSVAACTLQDASSSAREEDLRRQAAAHAVPAPVEYQTNSNYTESESTQSTLDAQAVADLHDITHPGHHTLSGPANKGNRDTQLLSPAASLPKIERQSAPYVCAREPRPNARTRMCSYIKTLLPCLGTHSQVRII